jgi:SAM-dependent methyltransferase
MPTLPVTERLRRFLFAYWLRPENALWMTLRSLVLDRAPWVEPAADLACGDGVFTFLHRGGVFDEAFDVFQCVAGEESDRRPVADMFDHVDDGYRPAVRRIPEQRVSLGVDLKESLLARARRLGFHERLVRHDCEQPLPLPDACLRTVYCNACYWVRNIDAFLRELARVVTPDGRVILQVKTDAIRDASLERFRPVLPERFLEVIGAGRRACWPSLADRGTWERRFERAGLRIERADPFITATHGYLWDVGLRPIAAMLIRMANGLSPELRLDVKREWVARVHVLAEPLCDPAMDLTSRRVEPIEIQYVLTGGKRC